MTYFALGSALVLLAAAALMYVLMRSVLPRLVGAMARSQELLLIFAIAWGTGLAALGEWAGFSKEAGAFMAGFSLASTAYREAIARELYGGLAKPANGPLPPGLWPHDPTLPPLPYDPAAAAALLDPQPSTLNHSIPPSRLRYNCQDRRAGANAQPGGWRTG